MMTEALDLSLDGAVDESSRRLAARGHADVQRSWIAAAWSEALYPELELRVGDRLSAGMPSELLEEFEQLLDAGDDARATAWLQERAPEYPAVIAEEFERLLVEAVDWMSRAAVVRGWGVEDA